METAKGYDTSKKVYSHNKMGGDMYSPNAGENHMTYDSSSSRSSTSSIGDSAGVKDGLAYLDAAPVKNAEMVTENQRPEGRRESAGDGFVMGC